MLLESVMESAVERLELSCAILVTGSNRGVLHFKVDRHYMNKCSVILQVWARASSNTISVKPTTSSYLASANQLLRPQGFTEPPYGQRKLPNRRQDREHLQD